MILLGHLKENIKDNLDKFFHNIYTHLDYVIVATGGAAIGQADVFNWAGEGLHLVLKVITSCLCAAAGVLTVKLIHHFFPAKDGKAVEVQGKDKSE